MDIFRRESKSVLQRSVPPSFFFFFYLFPRFFCDSNLIPPLYLLPHSQVSAFPLALHLCFTPFMPHFICCCLISSSADAVALIATPPRRGLALMDKGYEYHWGKKCTISTFPFCWGCAKPVPPYTAQRRQTKVWVVQGELRKPRMQRKEGRGISYRVCMCVYVYACVYACRAGMKERRGRDRDWEKERWEGVCMEWGEETFFLCFPVHVIEKNPLS